MKTPPASSPMLKAASTGSALFRIRRLCKSIPEPTDYFRGTGVPPGKPPNALPGNILCFVRRDGLSLEGSQGFQGSQGSRVSSQHHRCVLVVSLKGSGRVCIDSEHFLLRQGEALLIFPFQFHSYSEVETGRIDWLFLTFEMASLEELEPLRASFPLPRPHLHPCPLGSVECLLVQETVECWLDRDRLSLLPLHLGLLLRRLAARRLQRPQQAGEPPPVSPSLKKPSAAADLVARVNGYVLPRLDRALGLAELAQALGSSESHLRAQFRAATGQGLGRHLRSLRLQKACGLLHTTGMPITEVAECCGFDSVYSFSRTFKEAHGVSPRAYRFNRGLGVAG